MLEVIGGADSGELRFSLPCESKLVRQRPIGVSDLQRNGSASFDLLARFLADQCAGRVLIVVGALLWLTVYEYSRSAIKAAA